jgi:hypothetical protein
LKLEKTSTRVWKRLAREERLAAARAFFQEPPAEIVGSALGVLVKTRHLRPQVARRMPPEEQASLLASVLEPGEIVASALLVALHLSSRRALLSAFLDAAGLPHDNGILKDEPGVTDDAVPEDKVRTGVAALSAFPGHEVETYLNTLWLQDPDRWKAVEALQTA